MHRPQVQPNLDLFLAPATLTGVCPLSSSTTSSSSAEPSLEPSSGLTSSVASIVAYAAFSIVLLNDLMSPMGVITVLDNGPRLLRSLRC